VRRADERGECLVSVASCAELAVAIAPPAPGLTAGAHDRTGIELAEITEAAGRAARAGLTAAELGLLGSVAGSDGWHWPIRFRAAKQAVARAARLGTGAPLDQLTVRAATQDTLTVDLNGQSYPVTHRELSNLDGMPPRRYVVAWTRGPQTGSRQ
jgi:hypothetical protein